MRKQDKVYRVVYCIRNLYNSKMYIGSSERYWNRYYHHISALRSNRHPNYKLQKEWNRLNGRGFIFAIIEDVDSNKSVIDREQYWLDYFKTCDDRFGYNIHPNAADPTGNRHSDETKQKMSSAKKGRKWSPETRKVMMKADRVTNHPMKGKIGNKHPRSTPIIRMDLDGKFIDEWESVNLCATSCGLHKSNIISCLKGRINNVKGYKFKYTTKPKSNE